MTTKESVKGSIITNKFDILTFNQPFSTVAENANNAYILLGSTNSVCHLIGNTLWTVMF